MGTFNKMKNRIENIKKVVEKKIWQVTIIIYNLLVTANMALAEGEGEGGGGGTGADDKWNQFVEFICPWIQRIGGGVILIGGIMFGLGWKDNDASLKTQGWQTIVGGCIVWALGTMGPSIIG